MDRFIKIATIPLLIGIVVLAYTTMRPIGKADQPEPAAEQSDDIDAAPTSETPPDETGSNQPIPIDIGTQVDIGAQNDAGDGEEPLPTNRRDQLAALGAYTPLGQVEKRGSGPINMILISGNGETWEIWEAFMERNADRYTMWAVALPGFGGGEMPTIGLEGMQYKRRPWLKNAGRAVLGLIFEEDIENPVLMGHQIGGQLAVHISLTQPEWIRSVISLDGEPAFILGEPTFEMTIQERVELVTTMMAPQLDSMSPGAWSDRQHITPEGFIRDKERAEIIGNMIAAAPMKAMHQYIKEFALSDLTKALAKAEVPILFVGPFYHVEDETFRTDREVRWFRMLAEAPGIVEVVFFYNSSSWITEDQPEYLDEAVRAYLAGEEVVGSPAFDPFAENTDDE